MADAKTIVVGGGPAGLAAACLLAFEGVDTILVAPAINTSDMRTTALMTPAIRLLERIGVWPGALLQHCAPLRRLEILDEMGNLVSAPKLSFAASELGLDAFGWNVPLARLSPELAATAERLGVRLVFEKVTNVAYESGEARLALESGAILTAPLLVAADGHDSLLRNRAGIEVDTWTFEQSAMVTNFSHSGPHYETSTERHRVGGVCTTVPLPGERSALVWMAPHAAIDSLMARPAKLAMEIQLATHGSLGLISNVEAARAFPMRSLQARRFSGQRTMLIGEAAHAFPPIGAQGLNMSLRDAGHVADAVLAHEDPGSAAALEQYHARRVIDVTERQAAITLMNRSLLADLLPLHLMRAGALSLIAAFPPLRQLVMRQGLVPEGRLPYAMRA
jgi:2-octaprenyl-6-methoxyphenol hydroxylase